MTQPVSQEYYAGLYQRKTSESSVQVASFFLDMLIYTIVFIKCICVCFGIFGDIKLCSKGSGRTKKHRMLG